MLRTPRDFRTEEFGLDRLSWRQLRMLGCVLKHAGRLRSAIMILIVTSCIGM